jgi:hypothetical protein
MSEHNTYEAAKIEIVPLDAADVITSSAFDGEDDYTSEWGT